MNREEGEGLYVKIPLSFIRFTDPLEQRKFEMRLAEDESKEPLLREIESLLYERLAEMTIGIT